MIYHRLSRCLLASLLLIVGLTVPSFAQLLPPDIVTSAAPSSPKERAQIDAFVERETAKLTDPERLAAARQTLVSQATQQGATAGFFEQFADSLNQKLMPLAANSDPRVRLNVGIIATKVAHTVQNTKLAPVADALLRDTTEAVVLWGLQCAKYTMPRLLQSGNTKMASALAQQVVQDVMKFKTSAPVIEEAYRTVCLNPTMGPGAGTDEIKTIAAADLQAFLPQTIALFEFRVKLYDDLSIPPVQPSTDTWVVSKFFVTSKIWTSASPAEQKQICQAMLALARGAQKQATVASPPKPYIEEVQQVGLAFTAMADLLPNNAGKGMKNFAKAVGSVSSNATPDEITGVIDKLEAAAKELHLVGP